MGLLKILRNLERHLREDIGLHLLVGGHFIEEVLSLGKEEVAEAAEGFVGEVGACLARFELGDIGFEVFKDLGSSLH